MNDPLLKKYGTSRNGHSIFAPSSSAMWLTCKGSLLVNAKAGDSAGYEAAEGTIAHSIAEEWSKTGKKPEHRLGTIEQAKAGGKWWDVEVTSEMFYQVGRFVDWCNELPGDHYFEQRVDLSELMPIPNQGGTADHFACEKHLLTITDLKYGTGVRVYAENNTQALLYAAGAFLRWDWCYGFQRIVIRICQPRLDVFDTWEIDRVQLLDFMEMVKREAPKAWIEDAPRTPSPKACRWCAGFERCPARLKHLDDIIDETFEIEDALDDNREIVPKTYAADDLQSPTKALAELGGSVNRLADRPVKDLSTAALAYAYGFRSYVERWFAAIGEVLLDRAENGQKIPYFTLSEGRKRRRWKSADAAKSWLIGQGLDEDSIAPRKLLSVKQAETVYRNKTKLKPKEVTSALEDLIETVQTKRTLVSEAEGRPDADSLLDEFDEELEGDE